MYSAKSIIKKGLSILMVSAFFLVACDKIDAPYATIKPRSNDTTDTTTFVRKVLLEDYTGHTCPNCPEGTQIGQVLQETSGGKVIMIAVHAGFFAKPLAEPFTADYRTIAGEAWNSEFGFASYPNGLVNRTAMGGSKIISAEQWGTSIDLLINNPPDAGMRITCTADTNTRMVEADIKMTFLNDLSGTYNVILCILEDGIVSAQKNSVPSVGTTPIIYDYEYKDMLRGTVTDPWGEFVVSNPAADQEVTSHFSFVMDQKIVMKNASLVAFITNADTKEVVQVEKEDL